jgi:chromosome segregation ATPase
MDALTEEELAEHRARIGATESRFVLRQETAGLLVDIAEQASILLTGQSEVQEAVENGNARLNDIHTEIGTGNKTLATIRTATENTDIRLNGIHTEIGTGNRTLTAIHTAAETTGKRLNDIHAEIGTGNKALTTIHAASEAGNAKLSAIHTGIETGNHLLTEICAALHALINYIGESDRRKANEFSVLKQLLEELKPEKGEHTAKPDPTPTRPRSVR